MSRSIARPLIVLLVGIFVLGCTGAERLASTSPIRFPARMEITAGDGQSATVGRELASALTVRVVDSTGAPIAGQIVNFRVVAGGGSLFAGAAVTDSRGRAAERWTLGTVAADSQRVEARAVDPETGRAITFATFSARAIADSAARLERLSPDSQSTTVGTATPTAPAVRAYDRYGNPTPGVSVAFRASEGGGEVSDTLVTADSLGVAKLRYWKLGSSAGRNTLRASVGALSLEITAGATARATQPVIGLSTNSLAFLVVQGGGPSSSLSVDIYNAGGGTLAGLTGTISYGAGATGWLEGFFTELSAPSSAVLRVNPGTLAPGFYYASVEVRAAGATNTPQTVQVTMAVLGASGGGGTGSGNVCTAVAGASVVGNDGKFLGTLTNKYDANSVLNTYGIFGSKYSITSIFNEYGTYGSAYSSLSAFNAYATKPPVLYLRGTAIAYLTINTTLSPRFDPRALGSCNFP